MTRCLLALGSNLGDRATMLRKAVCAIADLPSCQVLARSRWHETAPVGGPGGQGAFLNGALLLETQVEPVLLCETLLKIEAALGRERAVRWDARAIDIDLLLYGARIINTTELIVPHPRMSFRRFVLEPAAEIAGEMVHPGSGWTLAGLLTHLRTAPRYVAVAAANVAVSDWLATQLAIELGCPRLEETRLQHTAQGARPAAVAIESIADALDLLKRSHWQREPELCVRLNCEPDQQSTDLMPVVSGFWSGVLTSACKGAAFHPVHLFNQETINPALVIAVEPLDQEEFSKKMARKKYEKNGALPSKSRQEFGEILNRSGVGPLARIQTEDPAAIIQEAVAAIRSVWS